ncbi:MAG: ABC transporter permease [Spirochaetes bacterium]|nr:ABC transporter permease [Spirochaetota bacterium]
MNKHSNKIIKKNFFVFHFKIIKSFTSKLNKYFNYYGGIFGLIIYSFPAYFKEKKGNNLVNSIIINQIYFTGYMALKLIILVSLSLGAASIIELFTQLSKFGVLDYIGKILNIVFIRELGPLITAFVVAARSGTAIAAEISTMKVNEEVDALELLGIDPLKFIVFPRIVGVSISLTILYIYFATMGILGGFLIFYISQGIEFQVFINFIINNITLFDIFSGFLKSILQGLLIASISIYHGFQATNSTQIPQVTTKATMSNITAIFILNIILSIFFYI